MTIEIEQDVEVSSTPTLRGSKYPFRELRIGSYNELGIWVGDSFFDPGEKAATTLRNSAGRVTKQSGMKFSIRNAIKGGVRGARVWRVS